MKTLFHAIVYPRFRSFTIYLMEVNEHMMIRKQICTDCLNFTNKFALTFGLHQRRKVGTMPDTSCPDLSNYCKWYKKSLIIKSHFTQNQFPEESRRLGPRMIWMVVYLLGDVTTHEFKFNPPVLKSAHKPIRVLRFALWLYKHWNIDENV